MSALVKCLSNNWFIQTSPEISDTGSLYNDPGDENSSDESSVLDEFDGIDSNDDDTAELLESLQKLYMVFLHPNKQKEVQKRKKVTENLHLLTGNSKAKSHKLTQSEARRGMIHIYWRLMHQWLAEKEKPE